MVYVSCAYMVCVWWLCSAYMVVVLCVHGGCVLCVHGVCILCVHAGFDVTVTHNHIMMAFMR